MIARRLCTIRLLAACLVEFPSCCDAITQWRQSPWLQERETSLSGQLRPVQWLHIPKCGTSFATALLHLVCSSHISENASYNDFPSNRYTSNWNEQCGEGSFHMYQHGHDPLRKHMRGDLKNVAAMFREPAQRALSGWYHERHMCPEAATITDYAACTNGCAASMLLGYECFDKHGAENARAKEAEVVARVQGLGFVGLTEEYDLSVCLLHAMYGGDCVPVEFENSRPGVQRASGVSGRYDLAAHNLTSMPRGPDHAAYDAAVKVFWHNVKQYGVTRQACLERICPKAAKFFVVAAPEQGRSLASTRGAFAHDWPGRAAFDED